MPENVVASWRRSVESGVDPGELVSDYDPALDFGSRLVHCARPVIEQLADQIADIPVCVALTDDRARLLVRRDTTPWIGRVADDHYFAAGFDYAEGRVGTNGVGTVLESGESVHVVGAQHFVERLQAYACAGAPVRDPLTGRIEGVLDISCETRYSSPVLHSLVRTAAARIEDNLLHDRDEAQRVLFDAYCRLDARSRRAVLAVGTRAVVANAAMQTLLDPRDLQALQDHMRFVSRRGVVLDERVPLPTGVQVRLRATAVEVGSDLAGLVGTVAVVREAGPAVVPRLPAPRRAAPEPLGEGRCAAWRAAWRAAAEALQARRALLVVGEQGSGRTRLLTDLDRHLGGSDVVVQDAADVAARPSGVEPGASLLVLRDVDRVSADALGMLDEVVAAVLASGGRLAATATTPPAHDGLLARFRSSVTVPPLRARAVDLPGLVATILDELAPHREIALAPEAMRTLARHGWPGNVAELRETLVAALGRRPVGTVEVADLPESCQSMPRSALRVVDEAERDAIVHALRDVGGNRVAAATALGLARSTLYRKIRQYGITG
ncbi:MULTISPECIES: helix-turn-helix domain-containing protein [unclassified Pseudonocardia]|uniref:sigma-54-dependent Fis family transcriptional regulator n=1 Tax=unclassified Pseudonocardia TaxID=2619320 RepID=UPI0025E47496|nr:MULTISPECIES: helix-turn-helix domain-containing protein [unclassified Pseudonocardia]